LKKRIGEGVLRGPGQPGRRKGKKKGCQIKTEYYVRRGRSRNSGGTLTKRGGGRMETGASQES